MHYGFSMKLFLATVLIIGVSAKHKLKKEKDDTNHRIRPIPMNQLLDEDKNNDASDLKYKPADAIIVTPFIVNGVEVNPPGKYPYMTYAYGCGASLVAPNVLLSAAHCATYINQVQIGRHNLNNNNEVYETFSIVEKVIHPNYNSNTMDYDYMMLRLNGSSSHTPVVLDSGDISLTDGRDVIVMGWGKTSSGGSRSAVLMEVEVDVKSQESCNNVYDDWITNRMICASRSTGSINKDSCQGDSGGPLIDKLTGKQVGIVSWGKDCADPNYPGVYSKVQSEIDWINSYIYLWSDGNPAQSPMSPPTGGYCQDTPNYIDAHGDGCAWYENNSSPGCSEWAGCCNAGMGSPDEACCFCGGGTPVAPPVPSPAVNTCESISNRTKCNQTSGCAYNIYQSKCLKALSTSQCAAFEGKKFIKCKKNGCVLKKSAMSCIGRWQ